MQLLEDERRSERAAVQKMVGRSLFKSAVVEVGAAEQSRVSVMILARAEFCAHLFVPRGDEEFAASLTPPPTLRHLRHVRAGYFISFAAVKYSACSFIV